MSEHGFTLEEAGKGLGEATLSGPAGSTSQALGVAHAEGMLRQEQCWHVRKTGGDRLQRDSKEGWFRKDSRGPRGLSSRSGPTSGEGFLALIKF